MKLTTGPRIGQEKRQRLKQWNKDNDLKLASWNVRSLLRAGGLRTLTDCLKKAKLDITAVQETRWPGKNMVSCKDYKFYYSGRNNTGLFGTGFIVMGKAKESVIGFNPIDERFCTLRIKGKFFNVTFINVHAPTEVKDAEMKDMFYEKLNRIYNQAPSRDIKIVLGDFNAQVGRETVYRPTIGQHSLHEHCNNNGERLVDFTMSNNMVIASTCFPHKNIHKGTWCSPDTRTTNQIDHVLIDSRHASDILDVRSCRGPNIDSDHYLVRALFRYRVNANHKTVIARKFNLDMLKDDRVKQQYEDKLVELLVQTGVEEQQNTCNDMWNRLRNCMKSAAVQTVKYKPGIVRNGWFDDECKLAHEEKNQARLKYLQRSTRTAMEDYRAKRSIERKIFRKKKMLHEQDILRDIDRLHRIDDRRNLYRRIKSVNSGFIQQPLLCKDTNGDVVADEERCIVRWAEYFKGLLTASYPVNGNDETELPFQTAQPLIAEPSYEETREAILKLRNGKAAGSDGVACELLKCGGDVLWNGIHELIVHIWNNEIIPEEWKLAVIVPIYKKGDKMDCANYRGISLLNTTYKVFAYVLYQRLLPYAEENIGEYQCGFRNDRSTTDQLFVIRQIMEKCREFNVETHHLFVDFKAAYDSVIREKLWRTMEEFGFPEKLIIMSKLTLSHVTAMVQIRGIKSDAFETIDGVRQGDPLAALFFNVVLEKCIRRTAINNNNTIFTSSTQLLGYADDIDIMGRNMGAVKEAFLLLERGASEMGLKVNEEKTKYMIAPANSGFMAQHQRVTIGQKQYETVDRFTYLGSQVNSDNDIGDEVQSRIASGNRSFYGLRKMFLSRTLSRTLKIKLYHTLVRPIVTYGSETWYMTQANEQRLRCFEKKVLRIIFGPIRENGRWRRRFDHEINTLYAEHDIVQYIKIGRLRWLGHVVRMGGDRIPSKVLGGKPGGSRGVGRPRGRWKDAVENDLRVLGVSSWRTLAVNRSGWRRLLLDAKTNRRL